MGYFSLAWRSARMLSDSGPKAVRGKSPAAVRCAIYTRKSTEEGLDQEFNSLHAQREAAEAYIKSQKQLGWNTGGESVQRRRLQRPQPPSAGPAKPGGRRGRPPAGLRGRR